MRKEKRINSCYVTQIKLHLRTLFLHSELCAPILFLFFHSVEGSTADHLQKRPFQFPYSKGSFMSPWLSRRKPRRQEM